MSVRYARAEYGRYLYVCGLELSLTRPPWNRGAPCWSRPRVWRDIPSEGIWGSTTIGEWDLKLRWFGPIARLSSRRNVRRRVNRIRAHIAQKEAQ